MQLSFDCEGVVSLKTPARGEGIGTRSTAAADLIGDSRSHRGLKAQPRRVSLLVEIVPLFWCALLTLWPRVCLTMQCAARWLPPQITRILS